MEKMFEGKGGGYKTPGCCEPRGCGLEPPKWEPVEHCCPPTNTCEERCPPRTRARDAIVVDRMQVEACFLLGNYKCDEKPLPLIRNYVRMDIRRKGYCKVLTCIPPTRMRNPDGALCFSWNDEFRALDTGYYEGDVYIDGCLCITLLFYLPPCRVRVLSVDTEDDDGCTTCSTCGEDSGACGCNIGCCDRQPEFDEEYAPIPDVQCEECEHC